MKKFIFIFALLLIPNVILAKDFTITEIKNDLKAKIWLNEYHDNPSVSINIAFKNSGYIHDDISGLAMMLAESITEGAGRYKSKKFKEILEDNAIDISANAGADEIFISLTFLKDQADEAFKTLSLMLSKPRFDDDSLDIVRNKIIRINDYKNSDPLYISSQEFKKAYFGDHPYSNSLYGTEQSLNKIHKADLKEAVLKRFVTSKMMMAVAGDMTEKQVKALVKKHLSALPIQDVRKDHDNINYFVKEKLTNNEPLSKNKDIPQTYIYFGMPGLKINDQNYYDYLVMNTILGGGIMTSRLFNELRIKNGFTYRIKTSINNNDYADTYSGYYSTKTETVKDSIAVLNNELKKAVDNGFTPQELEEAKSYLIGSINVQLNSNHAISKTMLSLLLSDRQINYIDEYKEKIQNVKLEDLNKVTKEIINFDKMLMVIVGKQT